MTMPKAIQTGSYEEFFRVLGLEYTPAGALRPGRFNRISREGRRKDDAGFVILHPDGSLWGGNHAMGPDVCAYFDPNGGGRRLTKEELAELHRRNDAIKMQEREEQLRRQDRAALSASRLIDQSEYCFTHPYLRTKHLRKPVPALRVIRAYRLKSILGYLPAFNETRRLDREILLAPMYACVNGRSILRNVQMIDADGRKLFIAGGQKKGCYWCNRRGIRETQGVFGICEGVATGLSIAIDVAEREGQIPIFAAMDAGNLPEVAKVLQRKFFDREFVIFGDVDESGTGQKAAREAAAQTRSGRVQFPPIDAQITAQFQRVTGSDKVPSDFNDYLIATGRI